MNKIVYRAESKIDGRGPWSTNCRSSRITEVTSIHNERVYPGAWSDDLSDIMSNLCDAEGFTGPLYFGTNTFEMFLYWFGLYMDHVRKHYNIIEYTVDEYYLGASGIQCIFDVSKVTARKVLSDEEIDTLIRYNRDVNVIFADTVKSKFSRFAHDVSEIVKSV